jgi:hypothetical protein
MSSFSWGVLLNKLLNLGVLIGACWYLVSKYFTPYIKKNLKLREERLFLLEQEAVAFRIKKTETVRETEEQKVYAEQLLGKIHLWKNMMEEREALNDVERKKTEKNSLEYLKKRADGVCQEFLKREIMPQVFLETKEKVLTFFVSEEAQKKYIAHSLKVFAKREEHGKV